MNNSRSQQSNRRGSGFGGLVRKLAAPLVLGAAMLMPAKADAGDYGFGYLNLSNSSTTSGVDTPSVDLTLIPGTTPSFDIGFDNVYSSPSGAKIDFYSKITGYDLNIDSRSPEPTLNYDLLMQASGLSNQTTTLLEFNLLDDQYWKDYMTNLNFQIFDKDNNLYRSGNVWDYASNNKSVSLDFNSGDSYNLHIANVPEPSTIVGLATFGLMAAGYAGYKKWKGKKSESRRRHRDSYYEED